MIRHSLSSIECRFNENTTGRDKLKQDTSKPSHKTLADGQLHPPKTVIAGGSRGQGVVFGRGGTGHNLATFAGKKIRSYEHTTTLQRSHKERERNDVKESQRGIVFETSKKQKGFTVSAEDPHGEGQATGPRRDLVAGPRRPLRPPVDVPPK